MTPPVAVVTGAAGLIGAETCAELARRGARVVAIDGVHPDIGAAEAIRADVTDAAAIRAASARVAECYGRVDWLVHAAALTGRTPGPGVVGELASLDLATWRRLIDVNLTGALVCVQGFLDLLRRSDGPRVLLVGSVQGLVPTLRTGAYAVSKAALAGLTRQLAAELAAAGVTVNMLAPGPIADERSASDVEPTPLRRYGTPAEVAGAIAGVLDGSFGYMTGAVIPLDGGEHLRPRDAPPHDPQASGEQGS